MMGTLRFFMASCVVAFHLTEETPNIGMLAIVFFYSISGYLITLVLHETYNFKVTQFTTNRILRLYPAYLFTLGIGITASMIDGFSAFHPTWHSTGSLLDIFGNTLIFPWGIVAGTNVEQYRIIPSSWSVGVELCCYAILWLITSRSWRLSLITAAFSIAWYFWVSFSNSNPMLKYYPIIAAMLPFSLGSMAYFMSTKLTFLCGLRNNKPAQTVLLLSVVAVFIWLWRESLDTSKIVVSHWSYYANIALAFITVLLVNKSRMSGVTARIDKYLGDLAYPVFLGHFIYAFLVWKLFNTELRGWEIFSYAYFATIAASIFIVEFIDNPITQVRSRIREKATTAPAVCPQGNSITRD
ncbi:acyltransferase family protein [Pseudomonas sp. GCEP-101]|uniref:acyltransferase family protein n=1 Tax=Pseudomonas sp. GCEP-101 TaxID=2974552 RepID=UPI00223BF2BD|nr:acyltransferase [Pseudomonas sp. GCEP-101]